MPDRPARFAIHRRKQPHPLPQYAGASDEGALVWLQGWTAAFDFPSADAALDFINARMGDHAADARVERHTIH